MSKRAERLARYLEDELGWTVYDPSTECKGCGRIVFGHKYCPDCGTKQGRATKGRKEQLAEIEAALKATVDV